MPLRSGGKLVLVAPGTGEIILSDDQTAAQQLGQGYQPATPEDVARHNEHTEFGTVGQQALAQAERVVRAGTLGQVEGFGDEEDIRARAEVSAEEHPLLSFAADVAPDIALSAATGGLAGLATGAGRVAARQAAGTGVRAALGAAAKAAPRAALAGEALGGGLVAASQEAFQEGRQFLRDDPIEDAQNTLFWAGLGGALGGAGARVFGRKAGGKAAGAVASDAELTAAREAGELSRARETMPLPEDAGARTRGEPTTTDPETVEQFERVGQEIPAPSMRPEAPGSVSDAEGLGSPAVPPESGTVVKATGEAVDGAPAAAPEALEQATPLDVYVQSFDAAERDAVMDEVEDQILERLDEMGVSAKPGSKRWRAIEDEIVNARIKEAGGEFTPLPEPAKPKPLEVTPGAQQRATEAGADKGVARAEREALRSEAEDVVERVARGESPIREGGGWTRDARLARYQPEIIEVATKEARNDLNELNRLSQGIRERAVKQSDVAKNVSDNLAGQQAKARAIALRGSELAGSIRADAAALAGTLGKKRPQYFSGTARDLVSSLLERTKRIGEMTDGAAIFNELDDLKRVVDSHKVALEQGSRKSAKDPLLYQQLIPRVEAFANEIRAGLEDAGTFGRAGEMQRAYNKTYHDKWFPAKQVFEDSVFRATGRDYKAFSTLDAWESKITSLLQSPNTGERRHVVDMLDALKEMAQQRAQYGTASKAETGRIVELVDKIHRTFGLADETGAAVRRMQDAGTVAGSVAAGAGAVLGGLPGAIIGGVLGKGAGELTTGRFRNAFANLRGASQDMVDRSVDDWIATSRARAGVAGVKARKLRLRPEDEALLATAKRRGATIGFSQFLGDDDNPQTAFASKRDALMNDEKFMQAFSDEFGDMAVEHPGAYMVLAGKAQQVREFLLQRIPSSIAISMRNPKGYPPTNESIEDWSVYYNAATNPRSVFQSLARGDIRPQEVETLRTLYPERYEQLQGAVLRKISDAQQAGDDLDDQFLMRMNLLFDLDGAGSPAFSQRAANVARAASEPQQPQGGGKPFAPKAGSRVSPSNVALTGPTYGSIN
jgi:hypothetical protein